MINLEGESMNPYKVGQILVDKQDGEKVKVLAILGVLVFISLDNEYDRSSPNNYHYKEIDKDYTIEPVKGWVNLTADNWKERRDQGVFCCDVDTINQKAVYKLIGYEPKSNFPFKVVNYNGTSAGFAQASIYNNDGIEAVWND